MKSIHWGIIGCGDVTERKSGPAFNKIPGSRLIAVMRRDRLKAADYAQRHKVQRWYCDADDLIEDPQVNAVYVATPPLYHAEFAIKSMLAGKPVYVEKPMAANYADCEKMIEVSEKTGVPLFVAYYRRCLPYFLKVKEIIEQGEIGEVHSINIRYFVPPRPEDYQKYDLPWRVDKTIAGGGYFYDIACHQLDLLDFLFGPVSEISGSSSNRKLLYDAEDFVSVAFQFENGIHGAGIWDFAADQSGYTDTMEIHGDKGSVSFSGFAFSPVRVKSGQMINEYKPENPENIQYWLIKSIVEELQGNGKAPSNGVSGARTNRLMDMVLRKM